MSKNFFLMVKGAFIGIANVIPGLSGGTIAVTLGIYDRIIEAISNIISGKIKKEDISFLIKISFGAGLSIIMLSQVMEFLLMDHYKNTMYFFLGLVIGGLPGLIMVRSDMKVTFQRSVLFVLGAILVFGLVFLNMLQTGGVSPDGYILLSLLFAGFFSGAAMIIPGLSGSLVLLILGQYAYIISSVKNFSIRPIVIFGIAALAGIALFSKIIAYFIRKAPSETYYLILGLIIASCFKMFPGMPEGLTELVKHFSLFFAGGAISFFLRA